MSCSEKPNSSWLLTCPVPTAPTAEESSAVGIPLGEGHVDTRRLLRRATEEAAGRLPLWTVRIWVGDTEVVYRDFRAVDAREAVRLAAEEAMSRDLSECRDQLTMFLPRMAKGKTKEARNEKA